MRPHLASLLILLAMSGTAAAQDGCDRFAWPVAKERAALTTPNLPMVPSGTQFGWARAFRLALLPADKAEYVIPPERKPGVETARGGVFHVPAPVRAGVFQVTVSDEAWIDIIQDGRFTRAVGSSSRSDCPGVRKSVRFELITSPVVVQVSGVKADTISIIFGRVDAGN